VTRTLITLLLASLLMASVPFIPARPHTAPMPVVAVCAFDGGGLSVAGSVTRTDDGRRWLCTDDGNLVPFAASPKDTP
jgi:hypothetical protein